MSNLALVKSENFGNVQCDFYGDDKNFWMTREQIGEALEYSEPMIAISKIHDRHKDRIDKFSLTRLVNGRSIYLYSPKGVYEICRWSQQPKADAFFDWVYDRLEELRTGKTPRAYQNETLAAIMDVYHRDREKMKSGALASVFKAIAASARQQKTIIPVAIKSTNNQPKTASKELAEEVYRFLLDWFNGNADHFEDDAETRYGMVAKQYIYIHTTIFNRIMEAAGYNPLQALRSLDQEGLIFTRIEEKKSNNKKRYKIVKYDPVTRTHGRYVSLLRNPFTDKQTGTDQ